MFTTTLVIESNAFDGTSTGNYGWQLSSLVSWRKLAKFGEFSK